MGHRLKPHSGMPHLAPSELVDRLRDCFAYVDVDAGELKRIELESGSVTPMAGLETERGLRAINVGKGSESLCYTTLNHEADIWSVHLD